MYSAVHDLFIDGRELRVFSNGTGRPILMLHDLGTSGATFEPLTSAVCAASRELVAIDLPGSGHSDPVIGSDLDQYVGILIEALPQLSEQPLDLVGHGFGAYLAASIAADRPAGVRSLVLSEPTVPPRSGPPASARMPAGMALSGAVTTLRRGKLRQNLAGFSRAKSVLEQLAKADSQWWEKLARITAPTLVLGSVAQDRGDRAQLDLLAEAIPGAVRNTVNGPRKPHSTAPDEFARHVLEFCA